MSRGLMLCDINVAPRVGARVEICPNARDCELRHVAPRVGARVEIGNKTGNALQLYVAPRVGARVEIHLWTA